MLFVTCVVYVPLKIRDCKSIKIKSLVGQAKKIEVIDHLCFKSTQIKCLVSINKNNKK
jgi:hypothetical protein